MKKVFSVFVAVLVAVGFGLALSPVASAVTWTPWAVGSSGSTVVNGDGSITFTVGTDMGQSPTGGGPVEIAVWTSGQTHSKAFYSTQDFNGMKVGSLSELSYTQLIPDSVADPDHLKGPYLNIAVTDGTDFSFLLLDAMPSPLGQQKHVFSTAHYKFNESSGGALLVMQNDVKNSNFPNGSPLWGFDDVKNLTIAAGFASNLAAVAPVGGWVGAGKDDGIILALGNRGSSPTLTATIDGASVPVPEPATMLLLGFGLVGLAGLRRKFSN